MRGSAQWRPLSLLLKPQDSEKSSKNQLRKLHSKPSLCHQENRPDYKSRCGGLEGLELIPALLFKVWRPWPHLFEQPRGLFRVLNQLQASDLSSCTATSPMPPPSPPSGPQNYALSCWVTESTPLTTSTEGSESDTKYVPQSISQSLLYPSLDTLQVCRR